jgi:hypothetical protein
MLSQVTSSMAKTVVLLAPSGNTSISSADPNTIGQVMVSWDANNEVMETLDWNFEPAPAVNIENSDDRLAGTPDNFSMVADSSSSENDGLAGLTNAPNSINRVSCTSYSNKRLTSTSVDSTTVPQSSNSSNGCPVPLIVPTRPPLPPDLTTTG